MKKNEKPQTVGLMVSKPELAVTCSLSGAVRKAEPAKISAHFLAIAEHWLDDSQLRSVREEVGPVHLALKSSLLTKLGR